MPDKPCARNHPCPACGYADVRDLRAMQEMGGGCPMLQATCRRCGYVETWEPAGHEQSKGETWSSKDLLKLAEDLVVQEATGEVKVLELQPGRDGRNASLLVRWQERNDCP